VQVITRFSYLDFCNGVNDLRALRQLFDTGAAIRGTKTCTRSCTCSARSAQ
jgi:hypothetical protein